MSLRESNFRRHGSENLKVLPEIERENPGLLHGKIGADMCMKKFGFDEDILDAIKYHTTGKENMNMLTKVVFIADCTGVDRKYNCLEYVRKLSEENIDEAILFNLDYIIKDKIAEKKAIHPTTVKARNYLLKNL